MVTSYLRGMKRLIPLLFVFLGQFALAQKKDLTNEQLLRNQLPEITRNITPARWVSESTYAIGNTEYDVKTGQEKPRGPMLVGASKDKSVRVVNNEIYYSIGTTSPQKLTFDSLPKQNPTFSPDSNWIAYTKLNDLYTINLSTKKEYRLTNDGSEVILNGYASWVYYEEILGRASRYRSFWWSPDSRSIAFMRMDESMVPMFPIYSEEGQHGYIEETRYPKPGDRNPEVRIGMVAAEGGNITWADFNEKDDQIFGMPTWKPDGKGLLVKWSGRTQNKVILWDVAVTDGSKKKFYEEQQKAWIDLDDSDMIQYVDGMPLLISDKDGWKNIYLLHADGTLKTKLTDGEFWGTSILRVDTKKKWIIFMAKRESSLRMDLYRVGLDGKNLKRLTFGEYTHNISLSPEGGYFMTLYSNASTPPVIALYDINGKLVREVANAKGKDFDAYNIARTELVRVPSADGLFQLPMRIIWPENYDPSKKYPVWINIYGGPNAGTVSDGWRLSSLQQWWAREGFIQVAMDHRGSGHFGKKGTDYLYGNLGHWEMYDWTHLVKWLRERGGDSSRVLIQGFSYGGYISAYALGYAPDVFTHAIAGGSVTDWSLYDTHYTERFMGTPAGNPEGYSKGSVLTYAPRIRGKLLLYHGTMDDNVHVQNSLQLVKKLQESKVPFDFMVYPGGRHGWGGNQRIHEQNMVNRWVYDKMLGKPIPRDLLR
jgi:dipeptidyl-peptidase-4